MLKQGLIAAGYPAEDLAGYAEGAALALALRRLARSGLPFRVRDYQHLAADTFHAGGDVRGESQRALSPFRLSHGLQSRLRLPGRPGNDAGSLPCLPTLLSPEDL
jgi:hypothetical protein